MSASRLFILASIGCGLAPTIHWLIAFRFVQGLGASVSMVIPRAIVRDLHTGLEATRLMSLVMLVFSVCPILAPLIGSGLIVPFGWRAVFAGVTVAAALGLHDGGVPPAGDAARATPHRQRSQNRARRLWRPLARRALSGADLHGGVRHGELLCIPGVVVVHLYRPFRHDADAVQLRLRHQRHRLHRRIAVQRPPRRPLRPRPRHRDRGRPGTP